MAELLISLLIFVLVVALVWWVINQLLPLLPLPPIFAKIIYVVFVVIVVLMLISLISGDYRLADLESDKVEKLLVALADCNSKMELLKAENERLRRAMVSSARMLEMAAR